MKDLEKLMESVSEKANEVVALREDKESKQFEIMDTMRKNWEDFFLPVADKLYKFINSTIVNNKSEELSDARQSIVMKDNLIHDYEKKLNAYKKKFGTIG